MNIAAGQLWRSPGRWLMHITREPWTEDGWECLIMWAPDRSSEFIGTREVYPISESYGWEIVSGHDVR